MTDLIITIRRSGEDPDEAATLRFSEKEHDALAVILDFAIAKFYQSLTARGRYVLTSLNNTLMAARRPGDSSAEDQG